MMAACPCLCVLPQYLQPRPLRAQAHPDPLPLHGCSRARASSHEPRCSSPLQLTSAPSPARVTAGLRRVNVSTCGRPSSVQHKLGIVETTHFRISFGKHSGCFLQRVIYPPGVSLLSSRGRKAYSTRDQRLCPSDQPLTSWGQV